jgi:hypothetical protein
MSKKHYQALAEALYRSQPDRTGAQMTAADERAFNAMRGTWYSVLDGIESVLKSDNPRFSRALFREACETGKCRGMRQVA